MAFEQMFDHLLDAEYGWPSPYAVEFAAPLAAAVTIDPVRAGRVVHLNADGEFEMGVSGHQMAIFLKPGSNHPDVSNDGGTQWFPTSPKSILGGLVACGSYELVSTEFDADQTYAPNDLLGAAADNADIDVGGVLTNESIVAGDDAVCGVVSTGVATTKLGVDVLHFWPVWLPVIP